MSTSSVEKTNGIATVQQTSTNDSIVQQKKPTFGQKAKRHCAKFWWLHLIIFCISFLIIALCLVYVGLPRIAQDGVNAASLTVRSMKFLDSKANSFTFSQDGILHNPKIFTPTLDPFDASVYLVQDGVSGTKPMIQFPMPSIHAIDNSAVVVDDVSIDIANMDVVKDFTLAMLTSALVTTRLVGTTKLHIGALPVNTVEFDQLISYPGLNGLEGFNVSDVKINLGAAAGVPNLSGLAIVPNTSPLTINMGNVTLNMATEAVGIVGNVTINEMTLVPGENTFDLNGFLSTSGVLASQNSTGFLNLIIWGKSAVNNGEHLEYYEHALSSHNLTLALNVQAVLHNSGL